MYPLPNKIKIPGSPELWTKIANAFQTLPNKRNEDQQGIAICGLCFAYRWTTKEDKGYNFFRRWAFFLRKTKFRPNRPEVEWLDPKGFWYDTNRKGDLMRAKLALYLAKKLRERQK